MRFRDTCVLAFCRLGVAGLAPRAPGTWGTALACLLAPFVFLPLGMGGRVLALLLLGIVKFRVVHLTWGIPFYWLVATGVALALFLAGWLLRRRRRGKVAAEYSVRQDEEK